MNAKVSVAATTILIAVFSAGTGLVVRHDDQTNSAHAMMVGIAMQKTAIMKAETSAAMKQKQTDEMAEHDTMMNGSSSPDSMNTSN
jgi:hypothetical protein